MGDSNPDAPDQCPPRRVQLETFHIDETEVTFRSYQECVATGQCEQIPNCPSHAAISSMENTPVTCVTWDQAQAYCAWAGGRLPTEAEWEKAARGINGPLWPWGNTPPNCAIANFRYPPAYCTGGVIEVGSYSMIEDHLSEIASSRSEFGLLDVSGNAWEWVSDWYDAQYYRDAPSDNPFGPTSCAYDHLTERGECRDKVIRGGAYNTFQDITRVTSRGFLRPSSYDNNIGFRCAYN